MHSPTPTLQLVVLRAADLARSEAFYAALGLPLVREQHGSGPVHHACDAGGCVLELYPASAAQAAAGPGALMLGFAVASMRDALRAVAAGGTLVSGPTATARGWRAVVLDPDGHRLELVAPQGLDDGEGAVVSAATAPGTSP